MKLPGIKLEYAITTAATLAFVYMLSIILDLRLEIILALYIAATVAMFWMIFRILKDPYSTTETFDEYFYHDRKDIRRSGSE